VVAVLIKLPSLESSIVQPSIPGSPSKAPLPFRSLNFLPEMVYWTSLLTKSRPSTSPSDRSTL